MKKLGFIIDTLLLPFENALSRLKVIQQIALIIVMMLVFLLIQGGLSMQMYAQMQTVSQRVFTTSIQGFQATSIIRRELAIIREKYMMTLFDKQSLFISYVELEAAISSLNGSAQLDYSVKTELASQNEKLKHKVKELKIITGLAMERSNYDKLDQIFRELLLAVEASEDLLTNNAVNIMQKGNDFFEVSRNTNIWILVTSMVLSVLIGFSIAAMISKPLKAMLAVVDQMATGNFTNTIKVKGSREVKKLVDGINHAILSLRDLVCKINEQAKLLALASRELNNSSHEAGRSAEEVAKAMGTMAKAAASQSDQMTLTSKHVYELGELVRKVAKGSHNIAHASLQVSKSAENGQQITSDVAVDMSEVYTTTKEISTVIDEVNQTSEEIKGIVGIVASIAEQTGMLSINASIEAARAGERGKGFGVVATETRKLAEQSKQALNRINALIGRMIERSQHAVSVIQKGVGKLEASKKLSVRATATFANIFQELGETISQIKNVAQSALEMEQHNEQVIEAVAVVASISEEGMATTEEISATVEEQSASAEEVAVFADKLARIAESLQSSVLTFKI